MAVIYINNTFNGQDVWEVRREALNFVLFLYEQPFWCNESILIIF